VYFTDPHYAIKTSDADGAPTIPYSSNRLAWLVLLRHGSQPLLHGEEGAELQTEVVTGAAFLDANTGALIEAVTLSDLP